MMEVKVNLIERKYRIGDKDSFIYLQLDNPKHITLLNSRGNQEFIFINSNIELAEKIIKFMQKAVDVAKKELK
jgi:hypothetical protein